MLKGYFYECRIVLWSLDKKRKKVIFRQNWAFHGQIFGVNFGLFPFSRPSQIANLDYFSKNEKKTLR